jgi:hypothetical protein
MLDINASIRLSSETADMQFSEVQRFRQLWVQLLFGMAFSTLLLTAAYQVLTQRYLFSFSSLALVGVVLSGFAIFVSRLRLQTMIDWRGVQFRFSPFQLAYRQINWEQIDEIYVREYDALTEYGGLGARYGKRGNAYIVSGKFGLQMELNDGRKILLSTKHPIELERVIMRLLYDYEVS